MISQLEDMSLLSGYAIRTTTTAKPLSSVVRSPTANLTRTIRRPLKQKKGKLLISHRYNHLPLLSSKPGGFSRSWSYKTYPLQMYIFFLFLQKFSPTLANHEDLPPCLPLFFSVIRIRKRAPKPTKRNVLHTTEQPFDPAIAFHSAVSVGRLRQELRGSRLDHICPDRQQL